MTDFQALLLFLAFVFVFGCASLAFLVSNLEGDEMIANHKAFWGGFWSVFRHPITIYSIGFSTGFLAHALFQIWELIK